MAKLARQTAVEALLQINEEGGYSTVVFHNLVTRNGLSPQDTALCSVLVYGALERRLTLDHVIGAYSKTPRFCGSVYISCFIWNIFRIPQQSTRQ